jgi:pyruvate, water dikinase
MLAIHPLLESGNMASPHIIWFESLGMNDVPQVGGKNASLGEMISALTSLGVEVPNGFATTADAYRDFLNANDLPAKIDAALKDLDVSNVTQLAATGRAIRDMILNADLPEDLCEQVKASYLQLADGEAVSVAVRSSATAEDLPSASFAGQQETYLNIAGADEVLDAMKRVFASLFNDRAIAYRVHQGFAHNNVAISAGVQRMVRSDIAASGVMFTLDTESGFDQVVFITAGYGLGETVVQGSINPDEFYVHKPTLSNGKPAILRRHLGSKREQMVYGPANAADNAVKTIDVDLDKQRQFCIDDNEVERLAQMALTIEGHYGRPMDIEWAKDGNDGKLYIVQARPETVQSQNSSQVIERYHIQQEGHVLITGRSIGQKIGQGNARLLKNAHEMDKLKPGDVLVTDMTDPDWEPIMKQASAIVTNRGGRTCHAAIIARELGIPAVVGCGEATSTIEDGKAVTVNCASGETGYIYEGDCPFDIKRIELDNLPTMPTKIMLNVGNPERAFSFQNIPNEGVGLARLEFLISNTIGIHPRALLDFDAQSDALKQQILEKTAAYASPVEFYIEKLREGIATIAAAFYPKSVIVRLSDFKSNEYANLLGGEAYEPDEENPMIGFRGASRYFSKNFSDCFGLECEAVKRVRDTMGLTNVQVMVPFVRTVDEAKAVIHILEQNGLSRGQNDLKVIMMCEIPSNALLADEFLQLFDGFSIGSNDLTQLTLGLDRDSALVAGQFDERDAAVKRLLHLAIDACKRHNKYVGICGQGPSDHRDFAKWLIDEGIESMSLNPDSVLETMMYLTEH